MADRTGAQAEGPELGRLAGEPLDRAPDALVGATLEALRRAVEDVEDQRAIAQALQRYLLPDRIEQIAGLRIAARYIPGGATSPVGGDWYDAVALRSGAAALAIGDVVGHGVSAAARMAAMRSALRAYALEGRGPSEVLGLLNAFIRQDEDGGMATVLSGILDPDGFTFRFASAGHPRPLIISPSGAASFLDGSTANPLGVVEFPAFEERTAAVEPGSTLVLFTDGLVETREGSLSDGLDRLLALAAGWRGDPEQLCEELVAGMLGRYAPRDDVAVLAAMILPEPGPRLAFRLPAVPASLTRARRELGRWLRSMGASDNEAYELLVATGEACANCVAHAYAAGEDGWFEVTARADGYNLSISVRDEGRWRLPRRQPSRGMLIMRELADRVSVERSESGTRVTIVRRIGP